MRHIYIILLLMLACRPIMLLAENETGYLPSIAICQGGVAKQDRMVELKMSVDLSNARIRTQHTVALTPVLVSADGNREIAFPPIVIDGKTRHKVYLRAQRLESVELPPYHNDSAQVIICHSSKNQQYDYAATVPAMDARRTGGDSRRGTRLYQLWRGKVRAGLAEWSFTYLYS